MIYKRLRSYRWHLDFLHNVNYQYYNTHNSGHRRKGCWWTPDFDQHRLQDAYTNRIFFGRATARNQARGGGSIQARGILIRGRIHGMF